VNILFTFHFIVICFLGRAATGVRDENIEARAWSWRKRQDVLCGDKRFFIIFIHKVSNESDAQSRAGFANAKP
jgi:hypothetical protein